MLVTILIALAPGSPVRAEGTTTTTTTTSTSAATNTAEPTETERLVSAMCHVGSAECPSFSPDSKRIAFISDLNGTKQLWVISAQSGFPQLVTSGNTSMPHAEWSPTDNECIAFSTWPNGTNYYQIYTVCPDGTRLRRITPGGTTKTFGGPWSNDGKYLISSSNVRSGSNDQPCLLHPSGEMEWLMNNKDSMGIEDVSQDGRFALLVRYTGPQMSIPFILDIQTKQETPLFPNESTDHFYGKFAPDSRTIFAITRANQKRDVLASIKLAEDGKPGPLKVIAARPDADLEYSTGWALINPQGTSAVLDWRENGNCLLDLVDIVTGQIEHVVKEPGQRINDMSYSHDGKTLAMQLYGEFMPRDIWTLDIATKKFSQVTFSPHPGVNFDEFIRPEPVRFKSFDGVEIRGWLYKPKGQTAPCPYVIDFHGGPEAESDPTSEFQPLLARGIGVFAPNVRGSSGRGKEFADMDNGPLRVNAIKDIKSCAEFLTTSGIAAPKRLGISGHSGGGFMAMAGLAEFPDLFAAGLDSNGPIDEAASYRRGKTKGAGSVNTEYGDDEDFLKSISPTTKVGSIKSPVMILQGEKDAATTDANEFVRKLKERGIPVEYIVAPNEGHNLYKIENRIKAGTAKVEFFVKYLKP